MAFRGGRGRGRGRFGGGRGSYAKEEPFVLYPDIKLPSPPKISNDTKFFCNWKNVFESFWRSSPYYLGDGTNKSDPFLNLDPERYSDKEKPRSRQSLREFLQPTAALFPRELVQDSKVEPSKKRKKVQWDTETDLKKFDLFEKLEQKHEAQDEKGENEKKEGEEEDEGGDAFSDDGEYSDNGDYDQNVDFDDDEDDFNMEDDNDDEGTY